MSVATEFPPVVDIPERARRTGNSGTPRRGHLSVVPEPWLTSEPVVAEPRSRALTAPAATPRREATVAAPHALSGSRAVVAPLRLTRRGMVVVGMICALVGGALLFVAHASSAGLPAPHPAQPAVVTVQPGDTLWSIAQAVAPHRDPRAEVDLLMNRNHLADVTLTPGQKLTVN
jgi:LysM repeat protein